MTYLFRGNNFLGRSPDQITPEIITFRPLFEGQTSGINACVVGFARNSNGFPQMERILCPDRDYVLTITFPDISSPRYLKWIGSSSEFSTTTNIADPDVVYIHIRSQVIIGARFTASIGPLRSVTSTQEQEMLILPNPWYTLIGYTFGFQVNDILSNCNTCGCSEGATCESSGLCINTGPIPPPVVPCPPNAVCGARRGKCAGSCPPGYTCTSVNGKYQCIRTWQFPWLLFFLILLSIVIIGIIIFFALFSERAYSTVIVPVIANPDSTVKKTNVPAPAPSAPPKPQPYPVQQTTTIQTTAPNINEIENALQRISQEPAAFAPTTNNFFY